ncbi:hypothetical protein HETIRDRAFT_458198 [Heterobasidion irregulare TC 32-1]|uniref:General negative regulator of transcription subunit n=1 Tax=Heterobasidion irregulare (strain TC 32-1) TaxID=747525 RepID=W4KGL2_HETIT|nr:uncharacterized protein HETIRDRAFT_458198 [Heterobasidion irregulare TC 32-1]ETW84450.1 hypothetical protein HETIRDRAFT_458198 [Heterobasidion irregulare TC 32-1]
MAARKLQTEIDRTLKKVSEGVELFESIYDKMQASTNMTQKEKLETELKTQIKKLQRLRDQIKTWVASNDIKDKTALLENRRLIETQMEKFKACEKEMKTKAFSKGGLLQSAKLDPKAQEKLEATQWLQTCVEELLLQVEGAEAEIETLQGGGRKKGKVGATAQERLEELEHLNERRKWHVSRLEIMMRLLDNGSLTPERVNGLKDNIDYFVEANANDDYDEDEGMYDELNLDEEEEKFGLVADERDSDDSDEASEADLPPRTPSKKHDEESVSSSKRDGSPIMKKASVALQLRKHSIVAEAPKPPPNPNFAQQPMASILKAGLPSTQPRPPAPQLPPIRYAAAAAAAVTPSTSTQNNAAVANPPSIQPLSVATESPVPNPSNVTITQETYNAVLSSPSLTHPSTTSPLLSSTSESVQQLDGSTDSPALSEALSGMEASGTTSSRSRDASPRVGSQSPHVNQALSEAQQAPTQSQTNGVQPTTQPAPQLSPLPQQVQQFPVGATAPTLAVELPHSSSSGSSPLPVPQQQQPQFPPGVKVTEQQHQQSVPILNPQQSQMAGQRPPSAAPTQSMTPSLQQRSNVPNAFPGSLSDLVVSFENVKQKAAHRMTNLDQVHKLLEGSYNTMPQPQDTEKPKYYVPRNPYQTPSYYPQATNPILSSQGLFSQLDVETLFYVFYFLPGTYQQYLAAKELKRQSWRFHVKYLTWFQRHSEPQAITDEYEQGVYVYFDWEGSWCQRKKSDFRFEYRYLSED